MCLLTLTASAKKLAQEQLHFLAIPPLFFSPFHPTLAAFRQAGEPEIREHSLPPP
jgi:hypothetical protein